ncbi:hypothetical protein PSTG_01919 [Puccinia striiformis f. sp. tritici PST-78]|uniref:Uncharacterized protein n=1 Tax=Puccinia striiformis f. sp. tritici PST-78 TaxID=1165861 RepID=A0A0L0W0Q6_9BASI|nr:hypothetical protein PSTG_01919 [Puccinia striiformis f. sp. tritici PST-78]
MRVTAKDVTGKEVLSSISTTDCPLSEDVQTNKSLLNQISSTENPITSEHSSQQQQGKGSKYFIKKYK